MPGFTTVPYDDLEALENEIKVAAVTGRMKFDIFGFSEIMIV